MGKNDELREWNETLEFGQGVLSDMRRHAIRQKGWRRRLSMFFVRWTERWVARGKRWRDEDLFED